MLLNLILLFVVFVCGVMLGLVLKSPKAGASSVKSERDSKTQLEQCRDAVPLLYIDEEFTPDTLTKMLEALPLGTPVTHIAVNVPGQVDVVKNFPDMFDPASKADTVMAGQMGNLFGYVVVTDAYYLVEDGFLRHRAALYSIEP